MELRDLLGAFLCTIDSYEFHPLLVAILCSIGKVH